MPFPMKIEPIDFNTSEESTRLELVKPVVKSCLRRLFERQFSSVLKISPPDKAPGTGAVGDDPHCDKDGLDSLDKMVQNFLEINDKEQNGGSNRCDCFSCDAINYFGESNPNSSYDLCEILKGVVACASVSERNLLANTAKIVEKNKISKRSDDFCRKIVMDGLLALGYDASICKSCWKKTASFPAGEYYYLDVIIDGERLIIDIDFRSQFEFARSSMADKSILEVVPIIFVGKADRLQRIISIVSEAVKQGIRKKGVHVPPWRKAKYVEAKWLSTPTRTTPAPKPTAALAPLSSVNSTVIGSYDGEVKVE